MPLSFTQPISWGEPLGFGSVGSLGQSLSADYMGTSIPLLAGGQYGFQAALGAANQQQYEAAMAQMQAAAGTPGGVPVEGAQPGTGFDPAGPYGTGATGGGLSKTYPTSLDPIFQSMGQKYGLDPALLKAMAYIESGGTFSNDLSRDDGFGDGPSVGVMQIKPAIWGNLVPGADPYTPEGNIEIAAALMKQSIDQYGSWEAALTNVYFPTDDPNGTTQGMYVERVKELMSQYGAPLVDNGFGPPSTAEGAGPALASIWGGYGKGTISGFGAPSDNGMYEYGIGHGLNGVQHTGIDVSLDKGSPLYTPMGGVVTCAGTGNGPGSWGQGCSAFGDTMGGGVGRIEILLDNGVSLILGHSNTAAVAPGQRVNPGQLVGTSGGMVSWHSHIETRVWDPNTGTYVIVDPAEVFGSAAQVYGGGPAPGGYTAPPPPNMATTGGAINAALAQWG